MRYKKVVVLISIFFILLSCSKYDNFLYEVIDLKIANADNSGEKTILSTLDSLQKKSYAIQLEYTMKHSGEAGENAVPDASGYENEYKVSTYNIYSLDDFDTNHPAGTSLNEYFLFSWGDIAFEYNSSNTINSIIGTGNIGGGTWSINAPNVDNWNSYKYLILMHPPTDNGTYTFIVEITQSNNATISDTTSIKLY